MSDFKQEVELVNAAQELLSKANKGLPFVACKALTPEILDKNIIEKRLKKFSQSIISSPSHTFGHINITLLPFKTVSRYQNNMAIGFRWLKLLNETGENLIDPDDIVEKDDVDIYYIHHNDSITGRMSYPDQYVELLEKKKLYEVTHAEGEAIVTFHPGHKKFVFNKSAEGLVLKLEKINVRVEKFAKHHLELYLSIENYKAPKITAYNKEGVKLKLSDCATFLVYNGNKTAKNFTQETLPLEKDATNIGYFASFNGDVERVEIYFLKDREKHYLPVKTPKILPPKPDWDLFKNINSGPTICSNPKQKACILTREKLIRNITFDTLLNDENRPELRLNLPSSINSRMASHRFTYVTIQEFSDSKRKVVDFSTAYRMGNVYRAVENFTPNNGELDIQIGVSRIIGKVEVKYPIDVRWIRLRQGEHVLFKEHKVVIEGGVFNYFPPSSFSLQEYSVVLGDIVRAFDKMSNQIPMQKVEPDAFYRGHEPIKIGFWGRIEYLELAVCKSWIKTEVEFDECCQNN